MIFIHSSFRTGSTWFWSKFRELDDVEAYYEVLNEILSSLTENQAINYNPTDWMSKHPGSLPYLLEYRSLLNPSDGVIGFSPEMSFEQLVPSAGLGGDVPPATAQYLNRFIAHSKQIGRVLVLSCTRTLGRIAGLKRALPGFHILITRNIFHQWCSYSEQFAQGNPYFIDTVYKTLEHGRHDEILAWIWQLLPEAERCIDDPNLMLAFTLLHLHLYGAAGGAADLVVDIDALSSDPRYRRQIELTIEDRTGLTVNLSDVRSSLGYSFVSADHEVLTRLGIMVGPILAAAKTEIGRDLVDRALAGFLREARGFEFYASGLRSKLAEVERERLGFMGERDALTAQLYDASVERDGLRSQLVEAERGRSSLAEERDA